jgi:outer membrane protein assembly factor BamB
VDNVRNGFDLYQLDNGAYIRTFPTGTPAKLLPKQVAFGEDAKVVIGGSDHGAVYVFDRKTGKPLQVLHHADKGLVQTITVCNELFV